VHDPKSIKSGVVLVALGFIIFAVGYAEKTARRKGPRFDHCSWVAIHEVNGFRILMSLNHPVETA
jgi:hypothetical protein